MVESKDEPKVYSIADLEAYGEKYRAKMDKIFIYEEDIECITINASYPYQIELDRIPNPYALVQWIHHLTDKTWMTSRLVHEFIQRVYKIKGWEIYQPSY